MYSDDEAVEVTSGVDQIKSEMTQGHIIIYPESLVSRRRCEALREIRHRFGIIRTYEALHHVYPGMQPDPMRARGFCNLC